jgi:hypothetical protein
MNLTQIEIVLNIALNLVLGGFFVGRITEILRSYKELISKLEEQLELTSKQLVEHEKRLVSLEVKHHVR